MDNRHDAGMGNWLHCFVACYDKSMVDMGLDTDKTEWLPMSIKISDISAFKSTGENEGGDMNDRCRVFMLNGESFTLNTTYSQVLKIVQA
ncbi:hypothetical protein FAES_1845 [Fibrella aestuarina BUZ 2]|uniref:Uncharacterized protein n=1 Tax=Fibrella aestuarina BUZ 2 TaxID=1166018 RepID=I0K6V2_9BACT|nr:hypothetical protein [Fibrella aestuarina]CCG99855.1 hypothetical protein FAES_1845 [Fibrella aestuarina BUZ 2]